MPGFEAVLAAAGQGERWALTSLFRAYQPLLLRYLRSQEAGVADDLASDVWVAVARGLPGFDDDETGFRRWLFTIARRRVIDHRRKAARRRTDLVAPDEFPVARPGIGADRFPVARSGVGADPETLVTDGLSAQEAIDAVVASLTPDQSEALLLRVVAGLDIAEIADIMGRTPGSVRVLCHRAVKRLAARFPERMLVE